MTDDQWPSTLEGYEMKEALSRSSWIATTSDKRVVFKRYHVDLNSKTQIEKVTVCTDVLR